jgi:hypothetical protein
MIIDIICAILIFADIILGGVCYSYVKWKEQLQKEIGGNGE